MARRATVQDIKQTGEKDLIIPGSVDETGEPITMRVRKVHAGERNALLPQTPAHLFKDLPENPEARQDELVARETRWLESLTSEQLDARRLESADFCCRLIALATLDPILSVDDARRLGDTALDLAAQILEFSKNRTADATNGSAAPAESA